MTHYPHPVIAREGWPIPAILVILAATVWCALWRVPVWIITLFASKFFRDQPREAPQDIGAVLSPADGRVIRVERAHDVYGQREAILVSVFMNVFNVHSNRSPVDGRIKQIQYFPGKFVNADLDKASPENERNAIVMTTNDNQTVTFVQVAGLIARRILCYVKAGDVLARGQRYGFIRFGSRVDAYLPLSASVKVSIGDKVSASTTILAVLAQNG
jgi:phosphatidylserine decarboxylase